MLELILLFHSVKFCHTINCRAFLPMRSCLPASSGITGFSPAGSSYSANGSPSIKQKLCSTAHAEITAQDLRGDIRSPLCKQENLLFKMPMHLSTILRVHMWALLYLCSAAVPGFIKGTMSHSFSGYPLSPRIMPGLLKSHFFEACIYKTFP